MITSKNPVITRISDLDKKPERRKSVLILPELYSGVSLKFIYLNITNPMTIEQQIQEFLNGLPNIDEKAARRALIVSASLDEALRQQIDCDLPLAQWTPLVVDILSQYGTLADGRDAMIAVLETAKTLVGVEKQAICKNLIQQWRASAISQAQYPKESRKCPMTYSLRPQVRHFFDRDDILTQLITELRDAQKVMVMIDGIAGIGKTSLAVKVTEAGENRSGVGDT